MIRPTVPEDTPRLLSITEGTRVFRPMEIEALKEVLDDYHATSHAQGHRSVTYEHEGQPIGFAYYAPAAMTDRTWYLYWIAVVKESHRRGLGGTLLGHAEDDIRRRGGRVLFIETSSLPHSGGARAFYRKHGYDVGGVLKDFYGDGDDMVIFRKRLDGR